MSGLVAYLKHSCGRPEAGEGETRDYASKDRCISRTSQDPIHETCSVCARCTEFDIITYSIIIF